MKKIIIYHGSEKIIEKPVFGKGEIHNDYGQGFYTTEDIEKGKEWANRKTKTGFLNIYNFDFKGLSVFDLRKCDVLVWIAVLMHNRNINPEIKELYKRRFEFLEKNFYPKEIENYDVIIGFRADDAYFKFPMYFIQNELSVERLNEIYLLGDLGSQIAIMSEKAFTKLEFIQAKEVEPIYYDRYRRNKNQADNRFDEIRIEEINNINNTKIEDLMKNYDKHQ